MEIPRKLFAQFMKANQSIYNNRQATLRMLNMQQPQLLRLQLTRQQTNKQKVAQNKYVKICDK